MSSEEGVFEGATATGTRLRSRSHFPPKWSDAVFVLLFVAVAFLFARTYMSAEHFFYFWDFAAYTDLLAQATAGIRDTGIRQGLLSIHASTEGEYNQYFTLPLLPFALPLGGLTRVRFVEALAVLYVVPLCLVAGSITASLFSTAEDERRKRALFWLGATFCLLLPATWSAVLRAYPDVFACFFALLAVSLYCNRGMKFSLPRAIGIGACLAATMLLRRHFTYPALAFYGAFVIHQAVLVWGDPERSPWFGRFKVAVSRGLLVFGGHISVLLIFGKPFVRNLFRNNYYELYTSYLSPLPVLVQFFGGCLGWSIVAVACLGWITAFVIKKRPAQQTELLFPFLFCVLLGGIWMFAVRQTGPHYLLHFLLFLIIGLTGLTLLPKGRVIAGAMVALLGLNMLNLALPPERSPIPEVVRPFLAAPRPPLYRRDYAEMTRYMATLRTLAAPDHSVFVGGSSERINNDLLSHTDPGLPGLLAPGSPAATLPPVRFVGSPHVDSRDRYPLEPLLESDIVSLPFPAETHLAPKEQKVVLMSGRLFGEKSPVTIRETDTPQADTIATLFQRDFVALPQSFTMENGTRLRLYRRVRPTPILTAARTLAWMRDVTDGKTPGGQNRWVGLTPSVHIEPEEDARYHITAYVPPSKASSKARQSEQAVAGFAYIGKSRTLRIISSEAAPARLQAFVSDARREMPQPVSITITTEGKNTVGVVKVPPL
ncbi:MAG: hypothetical protein H8F28_11385, partial [Fibrella sp.]|nr:hypothetical protein [Armatimonadota bacterium]